MFVYEGREKQPVISDVLIYIFFNYYLLTLNYFFMSSITHEELEKKRKIYMVLLDISKRDILPSE